jgi:hypothetical protein
LDWLAHIEQYPGELPQSGWLHISKKHGSGRNWIAGVIARLWPGYAAINFNLKLMLNSGYNDRLSNKLIAVVDEIKDGGTNAKWDNAETMRSIMTEEFRTINPKYGRMREEFNSCRWLIFSNHIGALALDEEDRRLDVVNIDVMPKSLDYYSHLYRLLRRREFIAGVAQMLSTRNLSSFNPGAHAIVNKAKEDVIASSRSEADEILIELVNSWPVDVIHNSVLGELVTGQLGGKITGAHRHAFQRHGVKPYKSILKIKGTVVRVSILRNSEIWKNADPIQIRSEINRGPELPFGGARAFLDNLTAV